MSGLKRNNEGWYYISDNGIHYELLEGKTIGGDRSYTSDTLFIMLNIDTEDDEYAKEIYRLGCGRMMVYFMQMAGDEETDYLNEDDIKEATERFEAKHKELIEFIISNNIETY